MGSKLPSKQLGVFMLALGIAGTAYANGPSKIILGTAGNYAILAQTASVLQMATVTEPAL